MGNKQVKEEQEEKEDPPSEVCSIVWKKVTEIPSSVFQKTYIRLLLLDFNNISSIPETINVFSKLEELSIAANQLTSLPQQLAELTTLKRLNFAGNQISNIHESTFVNLVNLQELYLDKNLFTVLPQLNHLTKLQTLAISDNKLAAFFEENETYRFPPNLVSVRMTSSLLTSVHFLNNSPLLTKLDLGENLIRELPPSFLSLVHLQKLFLSCNRLDSLPVGFHTAWINLDTLYIDCNDFTVLPEELTLLPSLRNLDIAGNNLPKLIIDPTTAVQLLAMLKGENPPLDADDQKVRIHHVGPTPDLVVPNLYLGCYGCAKNKVLLNQLGITHILTVAEFRPLFPHLFSYKVVEIDDANSSDIYSHFEASIQFIESALNNGGKILVHCRAGVSRSATMVAAYLMHNQKLTTNNAIAYIKEKRDRIHPNDGFNSQLVKWEAYLKQQ